ncbi:ANK_REP_REGION domain-containing protein [Durusdinium trenchii]|uniref:ANK_REP_REGION domain-containing protein n=1 Tax=Durusdinium trenchii TaxID=1381693 RepID=A0ABP0NGC8_9DINO
MDVDAEETPATPSPLFSWVGALESQSGQGREVHEAFSSYVDSLAENLSKPVTPADTVRRPDSRLPRFRYAFQGPRAARALLGSPPADRALAYAKVADRVIGDLDRLGLAVRARRARRQLPAEGSSPRPVEDRTPRRVRPIEAGGAEQCYHQRLQKTAREYLERFGEEGELDLAGARELFKKTAGLESRSCYTAAGLERDAFKQLGQLTERELVSLIDAGGGALGFCQAEGRLNVNRPSADASAVTLRCEEKPLVTQADWNASFGQPPAWSAATGRTGGRRSHRQQLREELRAEGLPPSITALHDNVALARVGKAVLDGDANELLLLGRKNSLWRGANPSILAPELQQVLGTQSCRFPLLFVAAFRGDITIWNWLTSWLRADDDLPAHLLEDVEGWYLPIILCMAPPRPNQSKDSQSLLQSFFQLGGGQLERLPISICLLLPWNEHWEGDASAQPLHLLLERDTWPCLVEQLVAHGGFPHSEELGRMALVGRILAEHGKMKEFLDACAKAGEDLRPQSQAMAGMYLGILKNTVSELRCLQALQALLEHGLLPYAPLTPSLGQWPLHAAARHNCVPVVKVLLVAKADPFSRNVHGHTALDVAKASRSWAVAALIRRAPQKYAEDMAQAFLRHLEAQAREKDVLAVAKALADMVQQAEAENI